MRHESLGVLNFIDTKNNIEASVVFGKVKKKPTDYVEGEIKLNGQVVSKIYGSYLGFLEFDGKR